MFRTGGSLAHIISNVNEYFAKAKAHIWMQMMTLVKMPAKQVDSITTYIVFVIIHGFFNAFLMIFPESESLYGKTGRLINGFYFRCQDGGHASTLISLLIHHRMVPVMHVAWRMGPCMSRMLAWCL
jgi:hypothetical protein